MAAFGPLAGGTGETVSWRGSFQATAGVWRKGGASGRRNGRGGREIWPPLGQACFQAVGSSGGKELNKPKGLGHFSCDSPHRLSGGVGGVVVGG